MRVLHNINNNNSINNKVSWSPQLSSSVHSTGSNSEQDSTTSNDSHSSSIVTLKHANYNNNNNGNHLSSSKQQQSFGGGGGRPPRPIRNNVTNNRLPKWPPGVSNAIIRQQQQNPPPPPAPKRLSQTYKYHCNHNDDDEDDDDMERLDLDSSFYLEEGDEEEEKTTDVGTPQSSSYRSKTSNQTPTTTVNVTTNIATSTTSSNSTSTTSPTRAAYRSFVQNMIMNNNNNNNNKRNVSSSSSNRDQVDDHVGMDEGHIQIGTLTPTTDNTPTTPYNPQDHKNIKEDKWRKHGKFHRARLLIQDEESGGNTFVLSSHCDIRKYYDVAEKVLDQFLKTPIDMEPSKDDSKSLSSSSLTESYLVGNRLVKFLSHVLPTHPRYRSSDPELVQLRNHSQAQLVDLLQYMEQLALWIDQEEWNQWIMKDSTFKQKSTTTTNHDDDDIENHHDVKDQQQQLAVQHQDGFHPKVSTTTTMIHHNGREECPQDEHDDDEHGDDDDVVQSQQSYLSRYMSCVSASIPKQQPPHQRPPHQQQQEQTYSLDQTIDSLELSLSSDGMTTILEQESTSSETNALSDLTESVMTSSQQQHPIPLQLHNRSKSKNINHSSTTMTTTTSTSKRNDEEEDDFLKTRESQIGLLMSPKSMVEEDTSESWDERFATLYGSNDDTTTTTTNGNKDTQHQRQKQSGTQEGTTIAFQRDVFATTPVLDDSTNLDPYRNVDGIIAARSALLSLGDEWSPTTEDPFAVSRRCYQGQAKKYHSSTRPKSSHNKNGSAFQMKKNNSESQLSPYGKPSQGGWGDKNEEAKWWASVLGTHPYDYNKNNGSGGGGMVGKHPSSILTNSTTTTSSSSQMISSSTDTALANKDKKGRGMTFPHREESSSSPRSVLELAQWKSSPGIRVHRFSDDCSSLGTTTKKDDGGAEESSLDTPFQKCRPPLLRHFKGCVKCILE